MSEIIPNSRGGQWRRVYATSVLAASAAFTSGGLNCQSRGSRVLENLYTDSGDLKILDFRGDSGVGQSTANHILVKPFGTDTSNQTFSVRLWGIEEAEGPVATTGTHSWEATLLAEYLCTLGNVAGAAGGLVTASDLYADTITLTYGNATDNVVSSNGADLRSAWFRSDLLGHAIVAFEMDDGGSAVAVNGLYRLLW